MNTCRFCGKWETDAQGFEPTLKYGVRHYAHPDCALKAQGADFFSRLHDWQLDQFPALAAVRHGLYEELCERIRSRREKTA
jgi:hypothetical protein